jgi:hypothetical protein
MTINFRLDALRLIQSELHVLIDISNANQRVVEDNGGYSSPRVINDPKLREVMRQTEADISSLSDLAEKAFSGLECVHIDYGIKALGWWLKHDKKEWSDLKLKAVALRDAINNELKEYNYYQYPKNKGKKFLSWKTEWKVSIQAFPSIEIDAYSATDCYALEHNTASVFHCMRILERGLAAMADDFGLVFDLQQWNTIIEQIESKTTEIRKTLPRGSGKNERMQFLSEAAKEFFYFKDGWRNYVSHNRGRYDEHQAAGILEHARTFMDHLATQLSE